MQAQSISEAIDKTAQAIVELSARASVTNSATASLVSGLKFSIVGPKGEELESDMPKGVGGEASAPNPGWTLRAALASCTGSVIAMRAAKLGVDLDRLEVTVESGNDMRGMLGLDENVSAALGAFKMRVAIAAKNADAAQLEEIVRWADAHSPVACTLRAALSMQLETVVG